MIAWVLWRIEQHPRLVILEAPYWPHRPWYVDLLCLLVAMFLSLSSWRGLLWQGLILMEDPEPFSLMVWPLRGSV